MLNSECVRNDAAFVLLNGTCWTWTWLFFGWNVNGAVLSPFGLGLELKVSSGWMWGVLNVWVTPMAL